MFSSSSESKERLIQLHDHMNKPMFSSGSVSCCIPRSVMQNVSPSLKFQVRNNKNLKMCTCTKRTYGSKPRN